MTEAAAIPRQNTVAQSGTVTPIATVKIRREYDAVRLNKVLNHPDVRPWVADAGEGTLDVSLQVANRGNILLMGQHGGCLLFRVMPGMYEVHTQVLPNARGAWALAMVRAGAHWMFTHTDAFEIVTRVPRPHRAAKGLTIAAGMRLEFTREGECRFRGEIVPVDLYSFRIQDWVTKASGLEQVGRWFHERMHAEAARLNITTPPHGDDPNHFRYVGAAYEMVRHGQVAKAINFYNRWAVMARHAPVELLCASPVAIRFDIGILKLVNGGKDIEIIPC